MAVMIRPCPAPSSHNPSSTYSPSSSPSSHLSSAHLSAPLSSSLSALLGNCEASVCVERVQEEPFAQLLPLWKTLRRREELSSRFGIAQHVVRDDSSNVPASLSAGDSPSLSQAYHLLDVRVHREYSMVCTHFEELLSSYCSHIPDPAGVETLDFLVQRHSVCLQYGFAAQPLFAHYQQHRNKYHELFRAHTRLQSSLQGKTISKKQTQLDRARYRALRDEMQQLRAEGGVLFRAERSPSFLDLTFYGSLAAAAGDVLYKGIFGL